MSHHPLMQKKKTSKFRSGLEKQVADLLSELGVSYEYESKKISLIYWKVWEYLSSMSLRNLAIQLSTIILLILFYQTMYTLKQKDTGTQRTEEKSLQLREIILI